eukprot:5950979-Pleurochrysis_carterae.AAC.1
MGGGERERERESESAREKEGVREGGCVSACERERLSASERARAPRQAALNGIGAGGGAEAVSSTP